MRTFEPLLLEGDDIYGKDDVIEAHLTTYVHGLTLDPGDPAKPRGPFGVARVNRRR